ncbi:UDP-4-amino-4,6-dideoxy-N-acetyl-beta-L-altrosamine transaminase [Brachybacterium muris]|uniref:UDP-4-amino-4, 6-dideoxy-N-acetyl-beta-L-altrosamine transaminase n=1 Tax=Brachybacterium muris TaxID=219301 RepID=UPI0021A69556|nr:UDP-4-amino-4,6-dideoxy-N-acetyl-beta-L-altrosamine transaminase [Brachybacterium muris]MCT1429370.1 UDP-4-amino-4,6-dideoxy-N-acetyl-beta-L-altrosamine transaminase [Brachybacterium muris]
MRLEFIPYGQQTIDDDDISSVIEVLRSPWLTTGPMVEAFEADFATYVGASHAVAVSNGTAALHLSMLAAGLGPGDEVIVPAITFVASANAARYVGADVKFADVDPETFLIDVESVRSLITPRTKAIVPVDYGGMPCDYSALQSLADEHGLVIIEDACHAPGAEYQGRRVGSISSMTAFSFHPVKHITTGEGGMVTTESAELATRLRTFRSHGITSDFRKREAAGTWEFDQVDLGYNYRIADINCALGRSQLEKQPTWVAKRREIAAGYTEVLRDVEGLAVQHEPEGRLSAWHLYPVRITGPEAAEVRREVYTRMRADSIGVNVHYRPVYLNTYYRQLGYSEGLCPVAESVYAGLLSLPMWPGLDGASQERVVDSLRQALADLRPV